MLRGWRLVLAVAASLPAAGDFLGPEACKQCHPNQYERQVRSRHARALRRILDSPLPALLGGRTFGERGVALEYSIAPGGLAVTARKDGEQASALLEWAFGAGAQGITPVGRVDGRYIEHRVSWYERPQRLALTFGHPGGEPRDSRSALGLPQGDAVIYRCFHCHATGVERGSEGPRLAAMQPGVTCERCHGPGGAHAEAARTGRPKQEIARAILNPGRLPARAQVEVCGRCHRLPEPGEVSPEPELVEPITVRFQPVGFMASRCFERSRGFSCLTCHDPHEGARPREQAFYTTRCLTCHKTPPRLPSRCRRNQGQNCLPCHMRQTSPAAYLRFTDHRIRTY